MASSESGPTWACHPNSKKPGSDLERNCGASVAFVLVLRGGTGVGERKIEANLEILMKISIINCRCSRMVWEAWSKLRVNVGEGKGLWRFKKGQKVLTIASGKHVANYCVN